MRKMALGWLFGLLFTTLCIAGPYGPGAYSKGDPPAKPGIYHIKDKKGNSKYIGDSGDLKRRIKEHKKSGKIAPGDTVSHKTAKPGSSVNDRRSTEQAKIKKHKPYTNKSKGGEGRK